MVTQTLGEGVGSNPVALYRPKKRSSRIDRIEYAIGRSHMRRGMRQPCLVAAPRSRVYHGDIWHLGNESKLPATRVDAGAELGLLAGIERHVPWPFP